MVDVRTWVPTMIEGTAIRSWLTKVVITIISNFYNFIF